MSNNILTKEIQIDGVVQGVGFRPYIYRMAQAHSIRGYVNNSGASVRIFAQGPSTNINAFIKTIELDPPALAEIKSIEHSSIDTKSEYDNFVIQASDKNSQYIHSMQDYAICDNCLNEFHNPKDRRYRYPFISCTDCGPRYSVLKSFPFDRNNTSYIDFTPCKLCQIEYDDPSNRRFHAQNISCPQCGPQLKLHVDKKSINSTVIQNCTDLLAQGKILCIKGTSGYRLYCDAESVTTIDKLRKRKNRPDKPLAVMFPDEDDLLLIKQQLKLDKKLLEKIKQNSRPIVLLHKSSVHSLPDNISPGLDKVGVLLPGNGIEYDLLKQMGRPLIATSANVVGNNILIDEQLAEEKLKHIADGFLHHNLTIQRGLDDSVITAHSPIRLGRGMAPQEYTLPFHLYEPILALGAQDKNTVTLAWENRAVCSQHLGDMQNYEAWKNTLQQIDFLQNLYKIKPTKYLIDAHPGYTSHQWIKNNKLPHSEIQHHYAHASALYFEHEISSPMLVFTWDGTGYSLNKSLWGGETFLGQPGAWQHMSSIRKFKLPGGEQAIKEPWRIAASLCWHTNKTFGYSTDQQENIKKAWNSNLNCPVTSSVGRLFDAAASILGLIEKSSYDGQAAMLLEANATHNTEDIIPLRLQKNSANLLELDWEPLIKFLQNSNSTLSYRATVFHNSLVDVILQQCILFSKNTTFKHIGFTGGVFQNTLLKSKVEDKLKVNGWAPLFNKILPANDANISLGQIIEYGMKKYEQR